MHLKGKELESTNAFLVKKREKGELDGSWFKEIDINSLKGSVYELLNKKKSRSLKALDLQSEIFSLVLIETRCRCEQYLLIVNEEKLLSKTEEMSILGSLTVIRNKGLELVKTADENIALVLNDETRVFKDNETEFLNMLVEHFYTEYPNLDLIEGLEIDKSDTKLLMDLYTETDNQYTDIGFSINHPICYLDNDKVMTLIHIEKVDAINIKLENVVNPTVSNYLFKNDSSIYQFESLKLDDSEIKNIYVTNKLICLEKIYPSKIMRIYTMPKNYNSLGKIIKTISENKSKSTVNVMELLENSFF